VFASTEYGLCFTLSSFAKMYNSMFSSVDSDKLSKVFWGDYYYNGDSRKFMTMSTKEFNIRTFVQFILEPIYKIFSHTVSQEYDKLAVSILIRFNCLAFLGKARNLFEKGRL
jgi:U5 small nuclear ribonucleoprotein component